MSTNTTNYKLIKPDRTDNVLVEDINYNTEIIDQELKRNATSIINLPSTYVLKTDLATETTNGISKIATQLEVNTGVEDTKIVTSKKLKARLDSMLASIGTQFVKLTQLATESLAGIIKISTTAQVTAGTDNTTAISPSKLREIFYTGFSKSQNGYQKFPGGLIIQWGSVLFAGLPNAPLSSGSDTQVYFPIVFPNNCFVISVNGSGDVGDEGVESSHSYHNKTKSGFVHRAIRLQGNHGDGTEKGTASWIAIGY